ITRQQLITAPDLVEATMDTGVFVQLSGVLKRCAVKLSKICDDLRLLSSGPRAGLGEINLPAMQPGSSIMPGKVNPVIPEVVNQVCFDVIGGDVTMTVAAEAGQLQLNVFEPITAYRLLRRIDSLSNVCVVLRDKCRYEIRAGFFTDTYFVRSREILRAENRSPRVLVQVSGKEAGYLSGVDESIAVLKLCCEDWSTLAVQALAEGDFYEDWETVLTIEGP